MWSAEWSVDQSDGVEWLNTMSTNENHLAVSESFLAQNVLQVCSSSTYKTPPNLSPHL